MHVTRHYRSMSFIHFNFVTHPVFSLPLLPPNFPSFEPLTPTFSLLPLPSAYPSSPKILFIWTRFVNGTLKQAEEKELDTHIHSYTQIHNLSDLCTSPHFSSHLHLWLLLPPSEPSWPGFAAPRTGPRPFESWIRSFLSPVQFKTSGAHTLLCTSISLRFNF